MLQIKTSFQTLINFEEESLTWAIHENPVDYRIPTATERCQLQILGKEYMPLNEFLDASHLLEKKSNEWTLNNTFSGKKVL